ncbi:MAG: InlB B-repeat-containing protein [Clostridiales bacterium]|jgi:hypothetical protein|nr:InlB B-repeat-containing protein [Clostridiales bacterium]
MKNRLLTIVAALLAALMFAFAAGCTDGGGTATDPGNTDGGGDKKTETPATYTVSFFLDNGEGDVPAQTVQEGAKAAKPSTDPTRYGCTFEGWSVTPLALAEYDFNTAVSANTTLYAFWAGAGGELYTVTYDLNGGTGNVPPQKYRPEWEYFYYAEIPQKTGAVFLGWAIDGSNDYGNVITNGSYNGDAIEDDITLYACWGDPANDLDVFRSIFLLSMVNVTGTYTSGSFGGHELIVATNYVHGIVTAQYQKIYYLVWQEDWVYSDGNLYSILEIDGETVARRDFVPQVFGSSYASGASALMSTLTGLVQMQEAEAFTVTKTADGYSVTLDDQTIDCTVSGGKITKMSGQDISSSTESVLTYDGSNVVPARPDKDWGGFAVALYFPDGGLYGLSSYELGAVTLSDLRNFAGEVGFNGAKIFKDSALTDEVTADLTLTKDIKLYVQAASAE